MNMLIIFLFDIRILHWPGVCSFSQFSNLYLFIIVIEKKLNEKLTLYKENTLLKSIADVLLNNFFSLVET